MRWTKADLEALLDERVKISLKGSKFDGGSIASVLPSANNTMGKPIDYILDRTLLRPATLSRLPMHVLRLRSVRTNLLGPISKRLSAPIQLIGSWRSAMNG